MQYSSTPYQRRSAIVNIANIILVHKIISDSCSMKLTPTTDWRLVMLERSDVEPSVSNTAISIKLSVRKECRPTTSCYLHRHARVGSNLHVPKFRGRRQRAHITCFVWNREGRVGNPPLLHGLIFELVLFLCHILLWTKRKVTLNHHFGQKLSVLRDVKHMETHAHQKLTQTLNHH